MESESKENESPSPSYKRIQMWTDGETRQLLDLYAEYLADIGPMKRFRTKKDMWIEISTKITDKTPTQCQERYKTVLRRKKVAIENNSTSGSKRKAVEFEEELAKICLMDDSIEPEVQVSSQKFIKIEKSNIKKDVKSRKQKTVQETLKEIADRKEEARERRHREKMDLLKKLLERRE